jgi:hypothetical protein
MLGQLAHAARLMGVREQTKPLKALRPLGFMVSGWFGTAIDRGRARSASSWMAKPSPARSASYADLGLALAEVG